METIKKDHLKDIDFRTREERAKNAKSEFITWYRQLHEYGRRYGYSDRILGQLTMLSSVLWYLLPKKRYNKLTALKTPPKAPKKPSNGQAELDLSEYTDQALLEKLNDII